MKIFYHDDNDGKAAAHMVYLFASRAKILVNKNDFIPVNYADKLPDPNVIEKGETVFIVDYSFTEATIQTLLNISFKSSGNTYWYDHHKSSQEVEDYVKSTNICKSVIIDTERCGALITYDELIKGTPQDTDEVKTIVKYVDDYDRWVHNYPESLWFHTGSMMFPCGPYNDIWHADPTPVIEKGKLIQSYKDISNLKTCRHSKYFIKINDKRCIVLNTPTKSSEAFGKYFEKYQLAIRWSFNGERYEYSVYSSLEDIDCSKIAKHFDPTGGGHKGAAGFNSDKLLFKAGSSIRVRMTD